MYNVYIMYIIPTLICIKNDVYTKAIFLFKDKAKSSKTAPMATRFFMLAPKSALLSITETFVLGDGRRLTRAC